jgi:hypothetical protein
MKEEDVPSSIVHMGLEKKIRPDIIDSTHED